MTQAALVPGVTHRYLQAGGLRMHVAEAGEGPLVLLLHGFPESWYSWRHQLTALAAAGYHAVAPDQRGYCETGPPGTAGQPAQISDYTMLHLTGDVLALMDALGRSRPSWRATTGARRSPGTAGCSVPTGCAASSR